MTSRTYQLSGLLTREEQVDVTELNRFFADIQDRLDRLEGVRGDTTSDSNIYSTKAPWDDLRFPAQGLNPPGGVSDPSLDTTDGMLLFAKNATNLIAGAAQMPHKWKEGTAIRPHIHWVKTDSGDDGNVVWQLRYRIAEVGRLFTAYTGWFDGVLRRGGGSNQDEHSITSFPEIDMTGCKVSVIVLWSLQRVGGDSRDDYDNDAKLLEFDIHYQSDSAFGSDEEFVK